MQQFCGQVRDVILTQDFDVLIQPVQSPVIV